MHSHEGDLVVFVKKMLYFRRNSLGEFPEGQGGITCMVPYVVGLVVLSN